jgi:hypothetical protein
VDTKATEAQEAATATTKTAHKRVSNSRNHPAFLAVKKVTSLGTVLSHKGVSNRNSPKDRTTTRAKAINVEDTRETTIEVVKATEVEEATIMALEVVSTRRITTKNLLFNPRTKLLSLTPRSNKYSLPRNKRR